MKKVKVVKAIDVEVKPFILADFTQDKETLSSIKNSASESHKKVSKSLLKSLANDLDLAYDEKQIIFAKKILTAYLEREER